MQYSDPGDAYLRKTKILVSVFIAFFLYLEGPFIHNAFSQNLSLKSKSVKDDEAIEITSDRMRSMDSGKKIIFSGNVVGIWGDLEIRSDVFELYTSKDKNKSRGGITSGQTLEEVIALGNVRITRGTKKAKGDKAIYYVDQKKIVLTGSPKASAWEEGNKIEGKEMIFLLDEDRIVVNGRVEMKFFPKKKAARKSKRISRSRKTPLSRN